MVELRSWDSAREEADARLFWASHLRLSPSCSLPGAVLTHSFAVNMPEVLRCVLGGVLWPCHWLKLAATAYTNETTGLSNAALTVAAAPTEAVSMRGVEKLTFQKRLP